MKLRPLGRSGIQVAPLAFGGNVFGWTVDEPSAFRLLDTFTGNGFNLVDTADVYSKWAPGNSGGESETVIGHWIALGGGRREKIVLATKVGMEMPGGKKGLSREYIAQAVEDSLKRLATDVIDLYQSHWPDPATPHEETLAAYERLLKAGKVRAIGCSNFSAEQLAASLSSAREHGLPTYQTLQPEYNLVDRASYDGPLRDLALREGLGVITYYSLASGFLSGKYRSETDLKHSARGRGVAKYLNPRGLRILDALDQVGGRLDAKPAEVALAWLMQRDGVTAPIASATSVEQLGSFAKAAALVLSADDVRALDAASAP